MPPSLPHICPTRGHTAHAWSTSPMELRTTAVVAGGDALARADDGRAVLVEGALPGEVVRVEITETKKDLLRARTLEVLKRRARASRHRRACTPARAAVAARGSTSSPTRNRPSSSRLVRDALRRLAHLDDPPLTEPVVLAPWGYRTTVRALVVDGRPAYRRRHVARPDRASTRASIAHPLVDEILQHGELRRRRRRSPCAPVRVPANDSCSHHRSGAAIDVPDDTRVVGTDELRAGKRAWYHEEVGGRRFRISAQSFFQAAAGRRRGARRPRARRGRSGPRRRRSLHGGRLVRRAARPTRARSSRSTATRAPRSTPS